MFRLLFLTPARSGVFLCKFFWNFVGKRRILVVKRDKILYDNLVQYRIIPERIAYAVLPRCLPKVPH